MNGIKAVIFDMDGVLIDAREWHYEALNKALGHLGFKIHRHEHLTTYDGLPTRDKLKMLSAERGLPAVLHGFINGLKQKYTMDMVHALCKPVYQHQYALARLKNDGVKLAVASNSIRNTIEVMMEKSNLIDNLEFILSNEDVVNGKPDPEIYNKAINSLGLNPNECVIVEDNEHGIRAAKASGAHVMCVKDPSEVDYWRIKKFIEETCNGH